MKCSQAEHSDFDVAGEILLRSARRPHDEQAGADSAFSVSRAAEDIRGHEVPVVLKPLPVAGGDIAPDDCRRESLGMSGSGDEGQYQSDPSAPRPSEPTGS